MTQQIIRIGTSANDGTGDTLRSGAQKINANFSELYQRGLPDQVGNVGKFLSTDGTSLSWANATAVNVTGNAGTVTNGVYLTGSYADPTWIVSLDPNKVVPTQSGNAGKFLSTDGTSVFWDATAGSQTQVDWTQTNTASVDYIKNKPTLFSGAYADLTGKPTLSLVASTGNYADLLSKPTLATVASTGAYSDLTGRPTIFSGAYADLTGKPSLANVATTGDYADILNRPVIPAAQIQSNWTQADTGALDFIKNKPTLLTTSSFSVTSNAASGNGSLSYTDGVFTFTPASVPTYSITTAAASGSGSLSLLGSVFTFTPPDLPAAQVNADWNATSGKAQILNKPSIPSIGNITFAANAIDSSDSTSISFTPAVTFNSDAIVENDLVVTNEVRAKSFTSTDPGSPVLESTTTIDLTAGTGVRITSSPLRFASFTTTQRDLLSVANGDVIYNTTTNKFQGRAAGAWVDLH
jgi:hypothetical protein